MALEAALQALEDQTIAGQLLASGNDVDGDALTVSLVTGPQHGTLAIAADGSFTYTPHANYHGTDSFSYQLSDGQLASNVATVNILLAPVNDVPVVNDTNATLVEDGSVVIDLRPQINDVDGDPLTVNIVAGPQHGTLTQNGDGTYTYAPHANYDGSDSFTYQVNDGTVDSALATVSLTITAVNDMPVVSDASRTLAEDGTLTFDPLANASDGDGDTLTTGIVTGPQHGTLTKNTNGTYTYVPSANFHGSDSFTYKVNDGTVNSALATVSLTITTVNDVPVVNDASRTLAEGSTLTFDPLGNASDADGDPLSVVIVGGPAHGTLVRNADGSYRYTPAAYYSGSDSFTWKVNDGRADSNVGTLLLTITPVNDAPVALNDSAETLQGQPVVITVLTNDSDIDNTTGANAGSGRTPNAGLSVRIISQPANGSVTINSDGTLTYTPNPDYSGIDSFSYVASDGALDSAVASVTITVKASNHAPVANDDQYTGKQNVPLTFDPRLNDTDAEGNPLSALIVTGPMHGTLTRNANGTLTYTPSCDWKGTDTFTYQSSDGKARSNVATVRLVITGNQAPVAVNDSARVSNNQVVKIKVLANDSDPDGNALTTRLVATARHGTVRHNADGTFSYTPSCNFVGTDTFTYVANDGQANSNVAKVTITVCRPYQSSDAVHDEVNTTEDVTVVANDQDPDGDYTASSDFIGTDSFIYVPRDDERDSRQLQMAVTALAPGPLLLPRASSATDRVLVAPSHGNLSLNANGTYTYTPDKGWVGTDCFSYHLGNSQAESDVFMVHIRVAAPDLAPKARDAEFQLQRDGSVRIDFAPLVRDPDGRRLTLSMTTPGNGKLTRNDDGSYTYRPKSGFVGTDAFTYTVSNGQSSTCATIALNVTRDDGHKTGASVMVQSGTQVLSDTAGRYGYIVVNQTGSMLQAQANETSATLPALDWMRHADAEQIDNNRGKWWSAMLNAPLPDSGDLAKRSGLKVQRSD